MQTALRVTAFRNCAGFMANDHGRRASMSFALRPAVLLIGAAKLFGSSGKVRAKGQKP